MSNLLRISVFLWLSIFTLAIQAKPTLGTCTDYFQPPLLKSDGTISTTLAVRVLRRDTPVYKEAEGDKEVSQLEFGLSLDPVKLSNNFQRLQVMKSDSTRPLGWVATSDLLCAFSPLVNDKGIERKLFIKTPPSTEKSPQSVTAYPGPTGTECDPANKLICKQLSRFELYFIFADDPESKRYLLADEFDITLGDKPLVGWVDYDKGIPWNTVLGLRPKENIVAYPQIPVKTDKTDQEKVEIQGGKIWYDRSRIAERIPLLEIDKATGYYHVAASGIGIKGFEGLNTQILEQLKQADVFFLLDGTASMEPYIKSATTAAKEIVNTLRNDVNFRETSFRFGFRVYRDNYADKLSKDCHGGVCEGMPLSAATCHLNSNATYDNWKQFDDQISQVKETTDDSDDYPEQLFAGFEQTIQDIASCKDRTKLLFIIGDNGDRSNQLPTAIVRDLNKKFNRLIIFFLQTPSAEKSTRRPESYRLAYEKFQTQAQEIIAQLIPTEFKGKKINRQEYLLALNEKQLVEKIRDSVKVYSESAIVNEVAQQVRGGDSLENIITKWMAKGDMPVLYWQLLDKTACQTLGEQCQKTIDHRVIDAYIPLNDKVAEEFRMTAVQLDEWRAILRRLSDVKLRTEEEQRNEFIKILRQEIQDILGKWPVFSDEDKTLGELMKRKAGLPMREHSPLLQYGLKDLETMQRCELRRLITWVGSIYQVLNNVKSSSTLKVSFTLKPYAPNQCPLASEKGKKIPELVLDPPQKLGATEEFRYDRSFRGQVIYWLPTDFLP
jgi:hypothetical protein